MVPSKNIAVNLEIPIIKCDEKTETSQRKEFPKIELKMKIGKNLGKMFTSSRVNRKKHDDEKCGNEHHRKQFLKIY
ncbi:hypothetical protein SDC9_123399 [bioreactor metagenome]|uniref:Uncharacterized protein n=1 Tax=bioreactor metagenome TaxID=1076179 RepID=A0A645CHJ7_9ZZZZ